MRCPNCGTELIPGKPFCPTCGARALRTCSDCGAPVEEGFRFCPSCGAELVPQPPAGLRTRPPAPATASPSAEVSGPKGLSGGEVLDGERKLVTVMFCDLVGSTAIAERLDPEEYSDLLEQYIGLAFREIYRFEGIVNRLAGDGLMALFGAPVAHEDAPERAVRAALAIRDALARFSERLRGGREIRLLARIGVHTGPVVVGTVGNDLKTDYTAVGDTTNVAARLEALAQPGTVLMSDATYRMVRGRFDVRSVGRAPVKGRGEPVVVYEVLQLREAATPMTIAEEHGLTPLVGRSVELAQLDACFQQLSGGLVQIVAVVGEAGSGKSRLLYEFKRQLAGTPVTFLEARCSALNQMVAYHPWVAMLRQYFGIGHRESVDVICERIAAKVRPLDESLAQLSPVFCEMLARAPAPGEARSADERKREHFEAMGRLIKMESERAPVVMVIEDLHWIDDPSREMLERAVERMNLRPVMLVVTHRPEYEPRWSPAGALTLLHLRRLSDTEATQIIRAVAGAPLPPQLERLVLAKAEGSPFFAEEITRALLEGGYLTRDNGHHRLTRPVEEVLIPSTVQEVIAARLDRLGSDAKRVLQVASVLGRQFSRSQLEALLAGEGVDVARQLEVLEQRGIVHRKSLFSDDELRFGESLTQEVAYESLLLKQRRQLHERVGLLLEQVPSDGSAERSALLAQHLARSENREKAVPALLRAAADAEKVPSYGAAARFYRDAWELAQAGLGDAAPATASRGALDAAIGLSRMAVIYNAMTAAEAEPIVQQAHELAEGIGDTETLATLLTFEGMLAMTTDRGRFATGLLLVERGLGVAQQGGHVAAAVGISRGLAWSYLLDGRFDLARRTIDWVVEEMERLELVQVQSDSYLGALFLQARILHCCDDFAAAERQAAQTQSLAVERRNRTVQAGTAAILAQIDLSRGECRAALDWARKAWHVAEQIDNDGMARTYAAIAVLAAVDLGVAVDPGQRALLTQEPDRGGDFALFGLYAPVIVEALIVLDQVEAAERFARAAAAHAAGRLREMLSTMALADALLATGAESVDEAERRYADALAIAESLGAQSVAALARLGLGKVALLRGDHAASGIHLRRSLEGCNRLGLLREQGRVARLLLDLEQQRPPVVSVPQGT